MRVGTNLREKALLALEEALHESRYTKVDRTHALRFALAFLFVHGKGDPAPFTSFWHEIVGWNDAFRFSKAEDALRAIYAAIGAPRDEDASNAMWRVAQARWEARRGDGR
jgi:hypothetical protein